ncbi:MarR family transcriptional regulator [Phormidium tenue FACHB-886]|nr:MarR family transcriptional regulator [Phormidium tenue FACHB-886]
MKKGSTHRSTFLPLHPALAEITSVLLVEAADRTRHLFSDSLAPLKIQVKHFGILFLLAQQGSLSQVQLGKQLEVDRALIVRFVDYLEQLGVVQRTPNPTDRRSHIIVLTTKGNELLAQATDLARTCEEEFLAPLSEREQRQLHRLLARLLEGK